MFEIYFGWKISLKSHVILTVPFLHKYWVKCKVQREMYLNIQVKQYLWGVVIPNNTVERVPLLPPWCEVSLIICSIVSLILRGRPFPKFLSAVSNNLFQKNYNKPRALETSWTTLMVIEIGTKKSRSHWGTSDHLRTLRITAKFSLRFTGVRGKTLQKLSTLSPITVCN